ncbi:MAG: hypothetical protein NZ739_01970 [Verrucomicrobiae bacterium]|nr:hypothetical protein [Verrucomicrobiae bacterium]
MQTMLYYAGLALVRVLQALPLRVVARLGRACGEVCYWLDARHRKVALANLTACFGNELSDAQLRALVRENFRRIGENFACVPKTACMRWDKLSRHVEVVGGEKLAPPGMPPRRVVVAIGHFGNFELYARFAELAPDYKCATTYRALRQPGLAKLLQQLRSSSGCLFFERRTQGNELRAFMRRSDVILGLIADQHAGRSGLRVPFFGRECSTSPAPAIFALKYNCPLFTAVCYRIGLAMWRLEVGDEIPVRQNGKPRALDAIMRDVNRAFEAAAQRDLANWFWVHNRWKSPGRARSFALARAAQLVEQPASH